LPAEPALRRLREVGLIVAAQAQRAEFEAGIGALQLQFGELQAQLLARQAQGELQVQAAQLGTVVDARQPVATQCQAGRKRRVAGGYGQAAVRLQPAAVELQQRGPVGQGAGERIAGAQKYLWQLAVDLQRAVPGLLQLDVERQPGGIAQRAAGAQAIGIEVEPTVPLPALGNQLRLLQAYQAQTGGAVQT